MCEFLSRHLEKELNCEDIYSSIHIYKHSYICTSVHTIHTTEQNINPHKPLEALGQTVYASVNVSWVRAKIQKELQQQLQLQQQPKYRRIIILNVNCWGVYKNQSARKAQEIKSQQKLFST